ncbi:unnamed protein product, partial [Didymodactylos carnosus]
MCRTPVITEPTERLIRHFWFYFSLFGFTASDKSLLVFTRLWLSKWYDCVCLIAPKSPVLVGANALNISLKSTMVSKVDQIAKRYMWKLDSIRKNSSVSRQHKGLHVMSEYLSRHSQTV